MIRLGVAGLGTAFCKMLPAFLKHPGIRMVAAASPVEEERTNFARDFDVPVYHDAEELAELSNVDALYISTPTPLHAEHVACALRNGKHVLVEKPLSLDVDTALALVQMAEQQGVILLVGHSHSFDPPIQEIRRIVETGRLGRVRMIHNWCYSDWIYRPRLPDELNTALGGGVVFRQGAHQFDIIRLIGGGLVRSVRATTGIWDGSRPTEGAHTVFLEFTDGTVATAVYNGYDHFHSSELTFGLGEWGEVDDYRAMPQYGRQRRQVQLADTQTEVQMKRSRAGYCSTAQYAAVERLPLFGMTMVSCENGDIRQTPQGLAVYGDREIEYLHLPENVTAHDSVVSEFHDAIEGIRCPIHDGRWALATLEVCLAVLDSSKQQKEVFLQHQVGVSGR
ncbi:Gfo/Idh/MocA family protein [Alicyclobacillus suci]|uniref:Gfo/Idh/MocA family protein n=1 Tax=Alicyclobacillus suci TaxID=2816080 RepID=UPI001A8E4225|nr:Gfo/Idh/MocA family oxidoreductase [Alicyclobacillus suci]